ncbi:hypothetical protein Pst134EB_014069 [Puccinia striiformis f. sp. tritici]|nr:hypothetical protein Pst134EB_014069 [Puccinia striiformis f. sp. tritici]
MSSAILEPGESYQYLLMTAGPQDENCSPQLGATPSLTHHHCADDSFPKGRVDQPPFRNLSADSNTPRTGQARRLPLELRFTPVNSPTDNTGPAMPTDKFLAPQPSSKGDQYYARHCRLIGFTPLAEDSPPSSEEESAEFLGPRKVKAREAAPCALFYKRSDVFVSSEMKSQNVLAYSENHYRNLRFDDEISISPQPSNKVRGESPPSTYPTTRTSDLCQMDSGQENGNLLKIHPLVIDREPIRHTSTKDGLTSLPLTSAIETGAHFSHDCFHIFGDETDSPLTTASGAEQRVPWGSPYKPNELNSDLDQSISSINSSGIQSSLWDATLSSLTRATSPVSSMYSNVVSSYDHQILSVSLTEGRYSQSKCNLMEFPDFTTNTEDQPVKTAMARGTFNWEEDHGSLADDENDSDCSSVQLESDDDQESSGHARSSFQLISSSSLNLPGFGRGGDAISKHKSGERTGGRM